MLLNLVKTKAMIFNTLRNYDCLPEISIKSGKNIEVVEQHKMLGQIVRSNLKTIVNTEAIYIMVFKRMWLLQSLKALGCPIPELLIVLRDQIVSICEVGLAWWGSTITKHESNMLEIVLKTGLHIIFQEKYQDFKNALKLGNMLS